MNNFKYLCAFVALAVSAGAHAQDAPEEDLSATGVKLDGIVAIVNEGVVLQSRLDAQLEAIRIRAERENLRLPAEDVVIE